jgi:hypothetical protein
VVGKRVVAELVAGPMIGDVYDMVFYRPTYGNDNLSPNVRIMEKLHFESMCCERVADVDKCRRDITLASKVVFLKSWPRSGIVLFRLSSRRSFSGVPYLF